MRTIAFFFLILIPYTVAVMAQHSELKFAAATNQSGEFVGGTFSVLEDRQGFLWFGTLNGLVRYDGYSFHSYRHNADDSTSISHDIIRALLIDNNGIIWIGTQGGGLNRFDPVTEKFTRFQHNKTDTSSISSNEVWALADDGKGHLWIGTWGGGLNRFNKTSETFSSTKVINTRDTLAVDGIRSLLWANDHLWVGMHATGLYRYHPQTNSVSHFQSQPNQHSGKNEPEISNNAVYHIIPDEQGRIWIATYGGGINVFDPRTNSFSAYMFDPDNWNTIASNNIHHMAFLENGELWAATEDDGIAVLDTASNIFRYFKGDQCNANSLSTNRVRFIFEDSRGITWIGNETGVDKIVDKKYFSVYRHIPGDSNSLHSPIVRTIYKDHRGLIWAGAYNALLSCYDPSRSMYIHNTKMIRLLDKAGITAMIQDDDLNYWVGTTRGVFVFDKNENIKNIFSYSPDVSKGISDNTIQIIRKGTNGQMWIGTENGLNLYDTRSGRWVNYIHNPSDSLSISSNKIQPGALIIEDNGDVWAGTWAGGLNLLDASTGHWQRFQHLPEDSLSIGSNNVISLYKDENGILWVGTFGGGLNKYDPDTKAFFRYQINDGLPGNIVYSILPDPEGNLWLGTDNGLSSFDPARETFLNFDINDGLPVNQFFWGSSFAAPDGELFFGTIDGMISFFPFRVDIPNEVPRLALTAVSKQNELLSFDKAVPYIDYIELDHDDNSFQIEFTVLDFTNPERNQYAYELSGVHSTSQRVSTGTRNSISFANLTPGEYTLKISGANPEGVWNYDGINLKIIINPPFWQTIPFRVLLAVVLISLFGLIFRIRILSIRKQKNELELLVRTRTEELQNTNEELRLANEELLQKNHIINDQNTELTSTMQNLKETQANLLHAEKMASIGVLTAGVAHEMNNPLNFIIGGCMGLEMYFKEQQTEPDDEVKFLIGSIKTGVNRANSIVKGLNELNKKTDNFLEDCRIHAILDNCLAILNSKIQSRINIIKEFNAPKELVIPGNVGKLHQVFINIFTNAIQAVKKDGTIKLTSRIMNNFVLIETEDDGQGIEPDILLRVTDPFFTTRPPGEGTGLGLSITLNILQEHNGKMEIESEPDQGTKVKVQLPLIKIV